MITPLFFKGKIIMKKLDSKIKDKQILATYENYQRWMGIKDLPLFKIKHQKTPTDGLFAEIDFENPLTLYIDPVLWTYKTDTIASILYHEFTHIYDACVLFGSIEARNEDLLHFYTEYHATQIQVLKNCEFDDQKEIVLINRKRYEDLWIKAIIECISPFDVLAYKKAKRNLGYYLGASNMYHNICQNPRDAIEIKNPIKTFNQYIDPIKEILLPLNNDNIPNLETLQKLRTVEVEFDEAFIMLTLLNNKK